ncbi:TetR/AcrR family transcriptional regulator [Gordonia sp. VNK21]|uniref:TetR/AcrR family transcriptional regulator n=1 Tax=Gordonia sp. VNK21 TaxID=3382483 RepID=UPI0038D37A4F
MVTSPQPVRRTGGRSARVSEAVESAALDLLLDVGYSGLTIRGVAKAAGVAETTVYRRWPTINHLTAAALLRLAALDNPVPDTGNLEGDLTALLSQICDLLSRPEVLRVVRSAAAVEGDDPSVTEARAAFFDSRFAAATPIVDRAVARGEIPSSTDGYQLIEILVAPVYLRAVLGNRPIDGSMIGVSVAYALAGARSGADRAGEGRR